MGNEKQTFNVFITDRSGKVVAERIEAENLGDALIKVCPDDEYLCRNPYIILENVADFTRQIIKVELFEHIQN